MFEEIALGAGGMLIFLILIIITLVVVWGLILFTGGDKMKGTNKKRLKDEKYHFSHKTEGKLTKKHSSSEGHTIFHALFEALKEEDKKR